MSQIKPFDARYLMLAEDRLTGMSMPDMAMKFSMTPAEVLETLEIPEVANYMAATIANMGYNSRVRRANLIEKMINHKIEEAEEAEMWSRKDLAELIKLAQDEDKLAAPKGTSISITKNEQNNNYVTLMEDLLNVQRT